MVARMMKKQTVLQILQVHFPQIPRRCINKPPGKGNFLKFTVRAMGTKFRHTKLGLNFNIKFCLRTIRKGLSTWYLVYGTFTCTRLLYLAYLGKVRMVSSFILDLHIVGTRTLSNLKIQLKQNCWNQLSIVIPIYSLITIIPSIIAGTKP